MIYEIDTSKNEELDWQAKGALRTLQNVRNLISTFRYEVGFDRTKGIDAAILDRPIDDVIAGYTAEVYRLVETYEPNAAVISVTPISVSELGNVDFKVVIEID